MTRETFSYTHGDTGTKPNSSLDFAANERPNPQNFDWYWDQVTKAISGHADEFDRLDSNDDGIVDEADEADTLDGEHATAFADSGHGHSQLHNQNHDNTDHTTNYLAESAVTSTSTASGYEITINGDTYQFNN